MVISCSAVAAIVRGFSHLYVTILSRWILDKGQRQVNLANHCVLITAGVRRCGHMDGCGWQGGCSTSCTSHRVRGDTECGVTPARARPAQPAHHRPGSTRLPIYSCAGLGSGNLQPATNLVTALRANSGGRPTAPGRAPRGRRPTWGWLCSDTSLK